MVEKHRSKWTDEDKKKVNLDNVAKYILYKTLDKNMFAKIKTCTTAKEIWEKLTQLCEDNDQTKENKLTVAIQKFDNAKMKPGKTLAEFDERFSGIIIELISLGKYYSNSEISLKAMRALTREWDVKTIVMRESKDLNKLELHDLFADLKAYEFELGIRNEEEPSTSQQMKALAATTVTLPVEESTKSEKSTSEESSSESKNEKVECLMAKEDQESTDEMVFDFNSDEFTREDLVTALRDMVNEFKRLSQQLNEAKTAKQNLENKLNLSSCSQQKEVDNLRKPVGDITGLGYGTNECNTSGGSTQPLLEKDSLKPIKFVRSSMVYEHGKTEDQGTQNVTKKKELEESIWFLDSGCSRHMTGNKDILSEIVNYRGPTITSGDNSIKVELWVKVTPLSFRNSYALLKPQLLWHKQLNHLNFKSIATISRLKLVSGLPNIDFAKNRICNACQLGKQVRSTFKSRGRNSSARCLELLHMDLFGPILVTSLGGKKYTLVVIDDFSRFTWVTFLNSKDQTTDQLIKLLKRLQNERSEANDRIRSDRETEFLNQFLSSYLEDHGIKHELSAARSPQQNGVAERRNRTLKEAARTMLAEYSISQRFWAEAINTVCYTQNRSMINKNHEKTTYEISTGKQPEVGYFRIFGCKCFIHINGKTHLTAFDVKADNGIFLGYSAVSKAYRAYNQRTLTVEESIHIVFDKSSICHNNSSNSIHDLINNLDATNLEASSDDEVDLRKTGGNISKENSTAQEQTQQVHELEDNQQTQNTQIEEALEQEEEIIQPTELNPYGPCLQWIKDHPLELVIGNLTAPLRTRNQMINKFMHAAFVSQIEPKKIDDALLDTNWIEAMQEELNQFE
ncbi:uncharacterized protein LOC142519768 [Primulina tabacum]|uniref:uncharacterized protein LOC142519768 n=1 Tax=Primulina tabacum TaxID=48773 RepID=UPI003F59943A